MPSLRRTPACKLLRRPPPALPPVCRGHKFASNRLLRRDDRPSGCRARRWSPRLRKRPLLLGWTVLWDVLPRFLGISTQPELIGNLYRIDFLPLPKTSQGQSNPNLVAFRPRRAGGPHRLAAVAGACAGGHEVSRQVKLIYFLFSTLFSTRLPLLGAVPGRLTVFGLSFSRKKLLP